MTGKDFRDQIGLYDEVYDSKAGVMQIKFADDTKFKSATKKLKVLARATAEDKFILVSGIRGRKGIVGMTGEGITDARALKVA